MPIEVRASQWTRAKRRTVHWVKSRFPRQSIDVPGREQVWERTIQSVEHFAAHHPLGAMNRVGARSTSPSAFRDWRTVRTSSIRRRAVLRTGPPSDHQHRVGYSADVAFAQTLRDSSAEARIRSRSSNFSADVGRRSRAAPRLEERDDWAARIDSPAAPRGALRRSSARVSHPDSWPNSCTSTRAPSRASSSGWRAPVW